MTQALAHEIATMLDAAADKYSLPRALVRAVAWCESNGNPRALSKKGAMGVMQLMPATARALHVADPWNAAQNIEGGVRYLAILVGQYGEGVGLAAYNAGLSKVQGKPPEQWPQETQTWLASVQRRRLLEPLTAADDVALSDRLSMPLQLAAIFSAGILLAALAFQYRGGYA